MRQTVTFNSAVTGVTLDPSYHRENPAQHEQHRGYFFDHYIDLPVWLDGTNELCSTVGVWRAKIVFLQARDIPALTGPQEIVPIRAGDRHTSVRVAECAVPDVGFGIWVFVNFLPPGEHSLHFHSYRLWSPPSGATH